MSKMEAPKGAVWVKVSKKQESGRMVPCRWYDGAQGLALDTFPVAEGSVEVISERWGRGEYRRFFLGKARKSLGSGAVLRIEDPRLADRGVYPNDPANLPPVEAAAAVASAPPASHPFPPGVDVVPIQVFHYLYGLVNQDAQRRMASVEAAARAEVARVEAASKLQLRSVELFWQNQAAAARSTKEEQPVWAAELVERMSTLEAAQEEEEEEEEAAPPPVPPDGVLGFLQDPTVRGIVAEAKPYLPVLFNKLKAWAESQG